MTNKKILQTIQPTIYNLKVSQLTKEQAQWLVGAIDLRVKSEGLNAAGFGLGIAGLIQADFNDQIPPPASNGAGDQDQEHADA